MKKSELSSSGRGALPPMAFVLAILLFGVHGGCIKAPDVVIVDRYTALEVQASGNYGPLEDELVDEGISYGPQPYTSADMVQGEGLQGDEPEGISGAYRGMLSRADTLDSLRRRMCVGEAQDGLVVQRAESCRGRVDERDVASLLERENRDRRQVWRFIKEQRAKASQEDIRSAWRVNYLKNLPCEIAVQDLAGNWGVKECSE